MKQKVKNKIKPLTAEEILRADDRPESVKQMDGKKGRKPKWRAVDIDDEISVAVAVELERRLQGIPIARQRTPDFIFEKVAAEIAAEKIMSLRSVRRFFTTHRAEAIRLARMTQSIPERRKLLAELVGIYGPEIAKLSAVKCDAIFRLREGLSVSETLEFDRAIEFLIIGQKA